MGLRLISLLEFLLKSPLAHLLQISASTFEGLALEIEIACLFSFFHQGHPCHLYSHQSFFSFHFPRFSHGRVAESPSGSLKLSRLLDPQKGGKFNFSFLNFSLLFATISSGGRDLCCSCDCHGVLVFPLKPFCFALIHVLYGILSSFSCSFLFFQRVHSFWLWPIMPQYKQKPDMHSYVKLIHIDFTPPIMKCFFLIGGFVTSSLITLAYILPILLPPSPNQLPLFSLLNFSPFLQFIGRAP